MIPAFLFGAVLVLAQMTALRQESTIGPLDVALVGAALLAGLVAAPSPGIPGRAPNAPATGFGAAISNSVSIYGIFSAVAVAIALSLNIQRPAASVESLSTASLPFLANSLVIVCFMVVLYSRNMGSLLAGFVIVSLPVGVLYTLGAVTQYPAMMYEDRFTGFGLNPNQIALQSIATLAVLMTVIIKSKSRFIIISAMAAMPPTLFYGIATKSDAFMVCVPGILAAVGLLLIDRFRIKLWITIVVGAVLTVSFLLALAIAFPNLFGGVGAALQDQLTQGGQDTDRELLWRNGLAAWRASPWFGNGPGAWSGIGGPYQGIEAHNSIIDWMSIAGIFGLLPIFVIARSLMKTRKRFKLFRLVGIITLLVFTLFHFTFRIPVFWLAVAMLVSPFFSWADEQAGEGDLPEEPVEAT